MDKQTKIIATIGPTSDSKETIEKLIIKGVNAFRFNFKHNTIEWHNERIQRVHTVSDKLGIAIGTLIDLQGPEIRINMPIDQMEIEKDELLLFGQEVFEKSASSISKKGFSISHPQIIDHIKTGQRIIADNGAFIFSVEKNDKQIYLRSHSKGVLLDHKSINIPGADFPFPVLVDRDFEGLKLAQRNQIDFVALSFVRSAQDIEVLQDEMKKYKVKAKIIAKIETQKAIDNLESIIAKSDGIMVARGDMGVELPIEEVPYFQKIIIKETIKQGKPVITATQMLQSMIEEPYPTRAEISDIANATYDLTDAVMLSGETALGKYPVESVNMMRKTVAYNEVKNTVDSRLRFKFNLEDNDSILCDTAYGLYRACVEKNKNLAGFLVFTQSGKTARLLSRYRPLVPIYAYSPTKKIADTLTINYGVVSLCHEVTNNKEVTSKELHEAISYLLELNYIKKDQMIIVLHGDYWAKEGGTSTVKLVTV